MNSELHAMISELKAYLQTLRRRGIMIGLAILVIALFSLFHESWFVNDGNIIVGAPRVYTRERLVNDRFREATWLEKQIKEMDKFGFKMPVGRVTKSASSKQKLEANVRNGDSQSTPDKPDQKDTESPVTSLPPPELTELDQYEERVVYRERLRTI